MGAQRRRKMKMACTAVAFALVVLTLAGVTEAKQNTIVEMTRLRTHVGGKLANRRKGSSYASGSTASQPSTASTPAPTGAPTSPVKAAATISQTLTITSVTLSSYTGAKKSLFEGGYAVGLGIASITGGAVTYAAGCSCTSTAVAARRAGVKITFVAKVSAAKQAGATSNSKALTATGFTSSLSAVQSGVTTLASVTIPASAEITVAQPTVEIVVSGASGSSSGGLAAGWIAFIVIGIVVLLVGVFLFCWYVAPEKIAEKDQEPENMEAHWEAQRGMMEVTVKDDSNLHACVEKRACC